MNKLETSFAELLEASRLTNQMVSDEMGMRQANISRWKTGVRAANYKNIVKATAIIDRKLAVANDKLKTVKDILKALDGSL